jgi:DNA-binding NarL/FixJ family response regulator
MPLRILIVDDHDSVRASLRTLFEYKTDWQVCGEAADGGSAVCEVSELAPDVVILDLAMPVLNGLEAAKDIRRMAPATKIILFSAHDPRLFAGYVTADAVVSKSSCEKDLIPTIERLTN